MAALVATLLAGQAMAQPNGAPGGPTAQPTTGPTLTLTTEGSQVGNGTTPAAEVDTPPTAQALKLPDPKARKPVIWHDTSFIFDQSVSAETIGVGKDYQTRNPSYQLWFSFRPRVYLYEDDKQRFNINARFDMYKELTNSDDTTEYRQETFGDIWVNASYSRVMAKHNGWSTTVALGPRVLFPTSLESRANGVILTAGGGGGITQAIPLNRGSDWFNNGHIAAQAFYTHPFTNATTAQNDDVARPRTTLDARTLTSNQLSGGLLNDHQLLSVLDTGLQITPKLSFTVDFIFIQQWRYKPTANGSGNCAGGQEVTLVTGPSCISSGATNQDPQNYRLSVWFLTSVDYQVSDELGLSLGYYNYANSIGPDGQRRGFLYAPDSSRFFLTATIGLDSLYERIRGREETPPEEPPINNRVSRAGSPFAGSF
jgi:hypothetical protein